MEGRLVPWLLVSQVIAPILTGVGYALPSPEPSSARQESTAAETDGDSTPEPETEFESSTNALFESLEPAALRNLVADALTQNPDIARGRYRAAAAATRAPQVKALPDPVAGLNVFLLSPETRVGPQLLSASLQQKFPWFGKLALRERAALLSALEAEAEVETRRLDVLTEMRRLFYELGFLDLQNTILNAERATLVRFEDLAQARYASGSGLQQEIVRIQAQITTTDAKLLQISERRASLLAAINTLRDRPADTELPAIELPELTSSGADLEAPDRTKLVIEARRRRPEVAAIDARIAARQALIDLADLNRRPDITVGLSYTLVGKRDDGPGRLAPPPGNGDDILALNGSINLPVRTQKLDAERAEAQALRFEAEEARRHVLASIEGTAGDLLARLPLLEDHYHLLDSVLSVQAREALRSAETAYATGKLNAVDLLDAEVVLFDVEIAIARTRADWNVALAQLERTLAAPLLENITSQEEQKTPNRQEGAQR